MGGGQSKQAHIRGGKRSEATLEGEHARIFYGVRFFSHTPTVLGNPDRQIRTELLTRVPEREDIAAPIFSGDPLYAAGNRSNAAHTRLPDLRFACALVALPFRFLCRGRLAHKTPQRTRRCCRSREASVRSIVPGHPGGWA